MNIQNASRIYRYNDRELVATGHEVTWSLRSGLQNAPCVPHEAPIGCSDTVTSPYTRTKPPTPHPGPNPSDAPQCTPQGMGGVGGEGAANQRSGRAYTGRDRGDDWRNVLNESLWVYHVTYEADSGPCKDAQACQLR